MVSAQKRYIKMISTIAFAVVLVMVVFSPVKASYKGPIRISNLDNDIEYSFYDDIDRSYEYRFTDRTWDSAIFMLTLDKPVIDISLPFQIRVHYKEAGKTYFAARDGGFLICTEDIQITSMHPFYAVPRFFSWPQAIVDSYHRVLEDFVEVRRKDVQYYRDLSEKMNVLKRNESLMQWLFSSCRRLSQDAFDRKKAEVVVLLMFNKDFTYEENGWMCVDKEKSKPYNLCRVPQLCKVPEPELFEKLHVILKDVGHWKDRLEIFKSIIYENFKLGTAEERWYAYNVYCAYELLLKPIAITDTLLDCFKGIDFINYHL